jgi:hypothetical protein
MLTDEALQQLEQIGGRYCRSLGDLVDGMSSIEAQAHTIRIVFDAVLTQMLNRRGPGETVAFLRRTIDRIEADARARMQ